MTLAWEWTEDLKILLPSPQPPKSRIRSSHLSIYDDIEFIWMLKMKVLLGIFLPPDNKLHKKAEMTKPRVILSLEAPEY